MSAISRSIAGEIRRHRQEQGLSAQQLSDRCADLGAPIPRVVLSNLENGKRQNVTVAEVLILARALGVPPGVLIFPVGYVDEFEVLPGAWQEPTVGLDWLAGIVSFSQDESRAVIDSPLGLVREHDDIVTLVRAAMREREISFERVIRDRHHLAEGRVSLDEVEARFHIASAKYDSASRVEGVDSEELARLAEERNALDRLHKEIRHRARMLDAAEARAHESSAALADARERLASFRNAMRERGLRPPALPNDIAFVTESGARAGESEENERKTLPTVPASPRPKETVRRLSVETPEQKVVYTVSAEEFSRLADEVMRDLKKSFIEKFKEETERESESDAG
ncbi:helix-turn-helix domain-containing protein [Streptomyces sp. UG1]|uniref:helix-turn-helix domain-containing protein n=1 Tax=Streptomyces sp. UG1 TaxID=3417652 RepID=UPI003CF6B132